MNEPVGMMVYSPKVPEGQVVLAEQNLTFEQLVEAIEKYAKEEKQKVATYIGVNHIGFFFSSNPNWHPDAPNAFTKPLGCIPWVHIHELLGTVPEGTTGDFLNNQGQIQ